jgi:hypothetical protein
MTTPEYPPPSSAVANAPTGHVLVPRAWLSQVVATLWAYHNEDADCDGECAVMGLVRTGNALHGQVPALASSAQEGGR